MLLPMTVMAGIPELSEMAKRYENVDGATVMTMNKEMIGLFGGSQEAAKMLDEIVILAAESSEVATTLITEAEEVIQQTSLQLLTSVTESGAIVNIYVNQNESIITDLVLLVREGDETALIIISGTIDPDMIGEMVQMTM
jgi:hypothetical protein